MAAMWHYGSIDESRSLPDSPLSVGQTASQPPQQHIQPMELSPLTEERFMDLFMMFSCATGVRLNEQDFIIEGQQVNPWALHSAVFAQNGFDSVTASGKWPVIGAILGFPTVSGHGHVPGQLTDRGPVIAHRLQQIYQDSLRHFDQAYIDSVSVRLGSMQTSGQAHVVSQLHARWQISATLESGLSTSTSEATSILPSFPHSSCAELGAHRVPQDFESVQPNGDRLQRATQGLYLADHAQHVYPVQVNRTPGFQEIDYPSTHPLQIHQHQRSGREPMHGGVTHLSRTLQQQQQFLRLNVTRGVLTQQQARERFARSQATFHGHGQIYPQQLPLDLPVGGMPGGTTLQQISTIPQNPSVLNNDQMNPLQRVIQGHDPLHARQAGMLLTQQHHGSGFAGQNFNPPGMVLPQGQGSPQQSFVQPSLPVLPASVQSSSSPSTPRATSPGAQQTPGPFCSFPSTSLLQLQGFHSSLKRDVEEGENKLQIASATDSGDDDNIVRQLRAKFDVHKQRVLALQEYIDAKSGASGDPAQQSVIVPELARRLAAPFPKPTQFSPHVSINIDLLRNGTLAQMAGALPPVVHDDISTLLEERFKSVVMRFTAYTGIPLGESDLIIKDRQIIPLALHKAVFLRNGFDAACTNDEWPAIGVVLGFPPVTDGDIGQPVRCEPAIARQLQQLYDDFLRHFDQAYVTKLIPRLESLQTADQVLIQPLQPQVHQPTESDYQVILTSITSDLSLLTSEVMSILPQFASTSCVEFEAHRVLSRVLSHVLRLRRQLHVYPQMIAIPSLEHIQNPQRRQRLQQSAIARSIAHGMAQIFRKSDDGESSMTFGSVITASAGATQIRRPSVDEVAVAKVWVDEQKSMVFRSALDANANHKAVPDSDVQEYHRNLERLDQVLANVEKYIHIAFAALEKGDVVRRMFEMMASVKVQLENLKKPNPVYVLELHKIRGMIQEAENMDKGLRTLLGARMHHRPTIPARGGPWPPPPMLPPPPSMGIPPPPPPFTRPGAPTTTQEVASAPARDGEMSLWEGLFQEEVRIAMSKLRI